MGGSWDAGMEAASLSLPPLYILFRSPPQSLILACKIQMLLRVPDLHWCTPRCLHVCVRWKGAALRDSARNTGFLQQEICTAFIHALLLCTVSTTTTGDGGHGRPQL